MSMFWQKTKSKSRIGFGAFSDGGPVRAENQDAYGHFSSNENGTPREHLFVVADGMGGHARGHEASSIAVDVVQRVFFSERNGSVESRLTKAFRSANETIYNLARAVTPYEIMGTTCTVLAVVDRHGYVAHVGDTRAYRIRRSAFEQLTFDHNLAEGLLREGVLTKEEAMNHPQRHTLTRALGVAQALEVDVSKPIQLEAGEHYLLCSDGLAPVKQADIEGIVRSFEPLEACERLVRRAIELGSSDNVTALLVSIGA